MRPLILKPVCFTWLLRISQMPAGRQTAEEYERRDYFFRRSIGYTDLLVLSPIETISSP